MVKPNSLEQIRHSLAHLLGAAVLELYPSSKLAIGPSIEDGFYYDIEVVGRISDADLPRIEVEMRKILKTWDKFEEIKETKDSAKKRYVGNSYKLELIQELADKKEKITSYKSGRFVDLCRGGHIKNVKDIDPEAFKLSHVAGAYWRGSEKNPQLTRIYGFAFQTKKELDDHLIMLEEAKKRDHRKLGQELDLFIFRDEVGPGLPLLTEKGTTIRRELERFIVDEEIKRGYKHVYTPDLARVKLYEISGHYPYYKDTMYPVMPVDEDKLVLRPMSCPHHFMLYSSRPRSYRELPMKIAEVAKLYRYEKSGELTGLMRVRSFCLADSHIFCTKEQAKEEIKQVIELIDYAVGKLGLKKGEHYSYRLSLGDPKNKDKYYNDPNGWKEGETALREVLKSMKSPFVEAVGEAAFYGPKIDIQMKNVLGKEETAFTVQYDFCLPAKFKLAYTNSKGKEEQPVVIHRSSIGAIERTMALLIEHYAGAFPVWLSPVQAIVLPISDKQNEGAEKICQELRASGIRTEINSDSETLGKKIREAEMQKIPYLLVVGDKELENNTVAVRQRSKGDVGQIKTGEFIKKIKQEIEEKK